jgi:hypothetical protein
MRDLVNPVRDLFDAAVRHYALKLTCRGCRRQRIFPTAAVWWRFKTRGLADWITDVPKRFRCKDCGRRAPSLELVKEEANDSSLPFPSDRDWKRELRRRR